MRMKVRLGLVARLRRRGATAGRHLALGGICLVIAVPLIWMVSTAFKLRSDVFAPIPRVIPDPIVWSNFSEAWTSLPFAIYYRNTAVVAFGILGVQLVTVTLAAYAFARMRFPGQHLLFFLMLGQMMITPQSTFVPNYVTISQLGLLNTQLAIMLPYFASGLGVFLLRQAFKGIPRELEDAACLDGCSGLRFLWYIGVPLVRPTLIAFALISVSYHWNEFFWPLLVTDTPSARTLTVGLGVFAESSEGGAEWTLLMAATLIVVAPIAALFMVLQRQFISTFMQSGLK